MRLLFDENLSPRLPHLLADCFPDSCHVFEIHLDQSDDELIWDYARINSLTIVSRDSDFVDKAVLRGAPPKVLALQLGNCSTSYVEILLRKLTVQIRDFGASPTGSYMVLTRTGWLID